MILIVCNKRDQRILHEYYLGCYSKVVYQVRSVLGSFSTSAAKHRNSCFHYQHFRSLPPPTVSTQQRVTKAPLPAAGKRWSSRLTAIAAPWPWQQRCGNSCARSWKYVHLYHCICGSATKNRAVCGVFVSWFNRFSPMGIVCVCVCVCVCV